MERQTVEFYTQVSKGVVQQVGKSIMITPVVKRESREIKWLPDKMKVS